jgi:hypothetical protein
MSGINSLAGWGSAKTSADEWIGRNAVCVFSPMSTSTS